MKVNKLVHKIPHEMEKKIGDVDKKIPEVSRLMTTTVLNTKIKEVKNEIPDLNGLFKKTDYNDQILKLRENTLLLPIIKCTPKQYDTIWWNLDLISAFFFFLVYCLGGWNQ